MTPISRSAVDEPRLLAARHRRLAATMTAAHIPALLTADPIDIAYACGARNMTVFGMMGPSRFVLVFAEGPTILYEFAGCGHLSAGLAAVDEVRVAPTITANAGDRYQDNIAAFAAELTDECRRHVGTQPMLAVERVDFPLTDALRQLGVEVRDAQPVLLAARRIKQPEELEAIRAAVGVVDQAVTELAASVRDGIPEVEMWAEFHRGLIAREGEYVTTRLFQGGPNTFPYFREAGARPARSRRAALPRHRRHRDARVRSRLLPYLPVRQRSGQPAPARAVRPRARPTQRRPPHGRAELRGLRSTGVAGAPRSTARSATTASPTASA